MYFNLEESNSDLFGQTTEQYQYSEGSNLANQQILIVKKIKRNRRYPSQRSPILNIQQFPVINNIVTVARVSMRSQENYKWPKIFLPRFTETCKFGIYEPKISLNAVQLWFENPDCQASVFENGMIDLKAKAIEDINQTLESICKLISMSENVKVEVKFMKISNIISNGKLPFSLIKGMNGILDGIKFRVYKSGAIIIQCQKFYQIRRVFEKLCLHLRRYAI